jgi:hypothetical protein
MKSQPRIRRIKNSHTQETNKPVINMRVFYILGAVITPFIANMIQYVNVSGGVVDAVNSLGVVLTVVFLILAVFTAKFFNVEVDKTPKSFNENNWRIVSSKTPRFRYYRHQA